MSGEKKLLIIHHGALGDMVLAFPALIALREIYARIDVVCQKKIGVLARHLELIDSGIDSESSLPACIYSDDPDDDRARSLLQPYDGIVLFSFSRQLERSLNRLAAGRVRRIPPRPAIEEKAHVGAYLLDRLAEYRLIDGNRSGRQLALSWRRRQAGGLAAVEPRKILIHPGSGSRRKNWPFEYFLQAAEIFRSRGLRVEFIFGPAESHLADALPQGMASQIRRHVTDDLISIWMLLTTAGGYVGNDSGITHLAAFAGLSTVAIFGPSDPVRWAPVGRSVKVLRTAADCPPCFEERRETPDCRECLRQLPPETVAAALCDQVRLTGP